MKLKALSVCPPWCDHILWGEKRIENRCRRTNHRGLLAIHSSTTYDTTAPRLRPLKTLPSYEPAAMKGAIIGVVNLIDCITPEEALRYYPGQKEWINTFPGIWCWVLEAPRPLVSPVKRRGYPWIFEVDIPDIKGISHGQ